MQNPEALLFVTNGLHIELVIERASSRRADHASIANLLLEKGCTNVAAFLELQHRCSGRDVWKHQDRINMLSAQE